MSTKKLIDHLNNKKTTSKKFNEYFIQLWNECNKNIETLKLNISLITRKGAINSIISGVLNSETFKQSNSNEQISKIKQILKNSLNTSTNNSQPVSTSINFDDYLKELNKSNVKFPKVESIFNDLKTSFNDSDNKEKIKQLITQITSNRAIRLLRSTYLTKKRKNKNKEYCTFLIDTLDEYFDENNELKSLSNSLNTENSNQTTEKIAPESSADSIISESTSEAPKLSEFSVIPNDMNYKFFIWINEAKEIYNHSRKSALILLRNSLEKLIYDFALKLQNLNVIKSLPNEKLFNVNLCKGVITDSSINKINGLWSNLSNYAHPFHEDLNTEQIDSLFLDVNNQLLNLHTNLVKICNKYELRNNISKILEHYKTIYEEHEQSLQQAHDVI
ncbi:hypothetical protein [Ureaplasma ceti]|uniref:Uncharacterized protein n=1 Tax=Ureaplasma ceti TaxID=3119530 RepID=A0ABP9U6M3_9BACT